MMLLFVATVAAQAAQESARSAIRHLYAEYKNSDFSPLAHPERYFAPRLLRAIRDDERLAGAGSVGYLDLDPLCQCQDTAGFHAEVVNVTATSQTAAAARVRLDFRAPAKPWRSSVKVILVDTPAGWRISDIASKDEPSLLRALEHSNQQQRTRRR